MKSHQREQSFDQQENIDPKTVKISLAQLIMKGSEKSIVNFNDDKEEKEVTENLTNNI